MSDLPILKVDRTLETTTPYTIDLLRRMVLSMAMCLAALCASGQRLVPDIQFLNSARGELPRRTYRAWEDQQGLMWIGTNAGLCRYDGHTTRWFTVAGPDGPLNEVHQILEDGKGWLWLVTYSISVRRRRVLQIVVFHPQTHVTRTLAAHMGPEFPFKVTEIYSLDGDKSGNIALTTNDGQLLRLYKDGRTDLRRIAENVQAVPTMVSGDGTLMLQTRQDIDLLCTPEGVLRELAQSPRLMPIAGSDGTAYWTWNGYRQDPEGWRIFRHSADGGEPEAFRIQAPRLRGGHRHIVYSPSNNTFWCVGTQKLLVWDAETGELTDLGAQLSDRGPAEVLTVFFNREGKAWVTTTEGVYIVRLRQRLFRTFLAANPGAPPRPCHGATRIGDLLYVNTQKEGLYTVDLRSGAEQALVAAPAAGGPAAPLKAGRYILGYKGQLLFAHKGHLGVYDPATRSWREVHHSSGRNSKVTGIIADENEQVWIGTYDGRLHRWNPATDSLEQTRSWVPRDDTPRSAIENMYAYDADHLLISTRQGIYLFNHRTGKQQRFWMGGEGATYFPCDRSWDLHRDAAGTVWAAAPYCGLVRWNPERQNAQNPPRLYTTADGLSENLVTSLAEDHNGRLWVATRQGIVEFDKEKGATNIYYEGDGLSANGFKMAGSYRDATGTIYFASDNGITAFDPAAVRSRPSATAPLLLTAFRQYDDATDQIVDRTTGLRASGRIEMAPGDKFFTMEFALLAYLRPGLLRYMYRIGDDEQQWNMLGANQLQIGGLAYGQHDLHLRAEDLSGRYAPAELHFEVVVRRPLHAQTWFILLMTGLGLALIGLLWWYRLRTLRRRQQALEREVADRTATVREQADALAQQAVELKQLDRVKSRFFTNISHEFRTPLTLIKGPATSILDHHETSDQNAIYARLIRQNADQLLDLVNEILDLSKLEAGKLELQTEPVAFFPVMRQLVANFQSHAERSGIALEFEFRADEYLQLQLDRGKLDRIVNNLLSNAIKFTPPGGTVGVEVRDHAREIELVVRDTGPGIHADDLPHVFDRFYQTGDADAAPTGGTGIGLALCRELAQVMRGTLGVESTVGEGSRFTFRFPRTEVIGSVETTDQALAAAEMAAEASLPVDMLPVEARAHPTKVLVVEDNSSLRDYLQLILGRMHTVTTARNGREALDALAANGACHLVVSDVMMPVMDGYALLRELKAHPKYAHIPVIMLTARAALEDKLTALRIGVDDYLLKPFEEAELLTRVANLLHNSAARQAAAPEEAPATPEADLSAPDLLWLEKVEAEARKGIESVDFNVADLADVLAMSKRQLERRLKLLTGLSPHKYLLEIRLATAREFLEARRYATVKAVALSVGFRDTQNFSKHYRNRFGRLPSSYFA